RGCDQSRRSPREGWRAWRPPATAWPYRPRCSHPEPMVLRTFSWLGPRSRPRRPGAGWTADQAVVQRADGLPPQVSPPVTDIGAGTDPHAGDLDVQAQIAGHQGGSIGVPRVG